MPDWLSYSPADVIMISDGVYWWLFKRANENAPVRAELFSAAAVILLIVAPARWTLPALGVIWAWVGWSFMLTLAGPLNAIHMAFAPVFAVQAGLLAALGRGARPAMFRQRVPAALLVWAFAIAPLAPSVTGRAPEEAEFFGIAPDPVAIATIGFALLTGGWRGAVLVIVPCAWLATSAVTLDVFGAPERWIPITVLAVAAAEAARRAISARR